MSYCPYPASTLIFPMGSKVIERRGEGVVVGYTPRGKVGVRFDKDRRRYACSTFDLTLIGQEKGREKNQ